MIFARIHRIPFFAFCPSPGSTLRHHYPMNRRHFLQSTAAATAFAAFPSIRAADKGLLGETDPGIIEDPGVEVLVRCDDVDGVHGVCMPS